MVIEDITAPGDLMHIDADEFSTPEGPLIFSGKNTKRKILLVSCL